MNIENPDFKPQSSKHEEDFDAQGNPRMRVDMPDGTISYMSEEEIKEMRENEDRNNQ